MDFSKAVAIMDGSMNDVLMIGLKIIVMITISLLLWFLFAAIAGVIFNKRYIDKTIIGRMLPSSTKVTIQPVDVKTQTQANKNPVRKDGAAKGYDTKEYNNTTDPELTSAVKTGNWATAYQLLKSGVSPHGVDRSGRTLLDIAIKNKDKHMIQLLHSHGAESHTPMR